VFIIGEAILSFTNYPSTYQMAKRFTLTQATWWKCDSVTGPGYLPDQVSKEDSAMFVNEIWYYKRLKMINNEGYHDNDNFTEISSNSDSLRILAAGDSFTWGASADVGSSYVDVLESDVKKAYPGMVWNTGVPATGTNHALFTTKKYLPLQKSNYVVLGFFVANDFGDNLLPYDNLVFNNLASCYNLYDYDKDFKPFKISKREAFKKATGTYPTEELNFVQKILIRSRFLTFMGSLKDKIVNRLSGNKKRTTEQEDEMTTQYLTQLKDYVKENGAELIVLVIPSLEDVSKGKQYHYESLIKILNVLSVKYVEPFDQFTKDDYLTVGGGHWKNSGHIKAGHALSKYLLDSIKGKQQKTFRKAGAL
ncbi:MAG TPA: hypothetical protein VK484_12560, partial [Ferruginibacter sp.]|nr:hypothetical protein [Ferruginibacter sp.]